MSQHACPNDIIWLHRCSRERVKANGSKSGHVRCHLRQLTLAHPGPFSRRARLARLPGRHASYVHAPQACASVICRRGITKTISMSPQRPVVLHFHLVSKGVVPRIQCRLQWCIIIYRDDGISHASPARAQMLKATSNVNPCTFEACRRGRAVSVSQLRDVRTSDLSNEHIVVHSHPAVHKGAGCPEGAHRPSMSCECARPPAVLQHAGRRKSLLARCASASAGCCDRTRRASACPAQTAAEPGGALGL